MKKIIITALFACVCAAAWGQQAVVAVAPFEAKSGISSADANTITEIYSVRLAASRSVRVVTRDSLDKVVREHGFQMGDWSNDNKTAELARALNADWVVRGTLQKLDNWYVVTATLLDIKTLEIMGGADMRLNSIGDAYDNMGPFVAQTVQTISGVKPSAAGGAAAAKEYKVGDFGPAGGWIFYDKGRITSGWRYLEAAPPETEISAEWGAYGKNVPGTGTAVGTGKRNTETIVKFLQSIGERGRAAQYCDSLVAEGFDDWFLPSKDELNLMYTNLKAKGLGEFGYGWYWSSSESDNNDAWNQRFRDGGQRYLTSKTDSFSVRAFTH
jgi:TolB-like protein